MVLQKQRAIVAILSCLLSAAGCSAVPAEHVGASAQPIVGGELDTEHTNVFGLVAREDDGVGACSATLIAPNLLLTARHCVSMDAAKEVVCGRSDLGETHPPSDIFATNDERLSSESSWFRAAELRVPSEGDDTCGYDVALVILSELVPQTVAVSAVPRIDRDVQVGEAYQAVGYGLADSGKSGVRRMRTGLQVACEPGRCGGSVRGGEFRGETGVCEGDSGGPALDADGKVVGVVSRGASDCSTPIYTTVTAWRDLIIEVAQRAAEVGGYEPPFWVKSGSSDPPVVVPPEPPVIKAKPGEACRASDDCVEGSACYQAAASEPAHCVALCEADVGCRVGEVCVAIDASGVNACFPRPAPHSAPEASCAAARGAPSSTSALYAVGLGLALVSAAARRRGRFTRQGSRFGFSRKDYRYL